MKSIRVPIPTDLHVIDPTHAVVELHLVMGTCTATFTGLQAEYRATQYNDWVSNPDPLEKL